MTKTQRAESTIKRTFNTNYNKHPFEEKTFHEAIMSFHSWALFAGSFVPNVDENRATLVLYKSEKILLKIPWQSQDDEVPKSQKLGLAKGL